MIKVVVHGGFPGFQLIFADFFFQAMCAEGTQHHRRKAKK